MLPSIGSEGGELGQTVGIGFGREGNATHGPECTFSTNHSVVDG